MDIHWQDFHFIRPWALALLPVCIFVVWSLLQLEKRSTEWRELIDNKLLPYLLEGRISQSKKLPYLFLFLILLTLSFALAGPTWEKKPQPVQRDTSALVILWDLSPSMYAQDIKPSRIVRARLKLSDLLDERKEGLTALIAYAGDAHVVTPLTDDTKTIKNLLMGLSPNIMPSPGNNPEQALETAVKLFKDTNIDKGDIVFITDDIPYSAFTELEVIHSQTQHKVTVWGIGKAEGAPIPLPEGGFAKNSRGEIVIARVDHQGLSEAAVKMDGTYIPFSNDRSDIESILHFGFKMGKQSGAQLENEREKLVDEWREVGHWLVLACLPFAALAFRRGWLLSIALIIFMEPQTAHALEWKDLWLTQDQQAKALLEQERADAAAEKFEDQQWKAIANYKSGNFDAAQEHFQASNDAVSQYNLGNALTQKGEYDKAIKAFEGAINQREPFPEAEKNLEIAKKLKEFSEQQNQQNQQNQDNQDQQNGDDQNQSSQEQESNQQNKQQQDSQQNEQNQGQPQEQESADKNESKEQSQNGESSDQQEQQNSSEAQANKQDKQEQEAKDKQALEQHYNQDKPTEETKDEQKEQMAQTQQQKEDNENNDGKPQGVTVAESQMSPEEMEQQQALEQWLRRVPDDPSGLLREKFRYEHNKRRRENFDSRLRTPDGNTGEERW